MLLYKRARALPVLEGAAILLELTAAQTALATGKFKII